MAYKETTFIYNVNWKVATFAIFVIGAGKGESERITHLNAPVRKFQFFNMMEFLNKFL